MSVVRIVKSVFGLVFGCCTTPSPLFQPSAGLVTGQSKNTQSRWPAKFKPNLSHSVALQKRGVYSPAIPYALTWIYMFLICHIFANIGRLFSGAVLINFGLGFRCGRNKFVKLHLACWAKARLNLLLLIRHHKKLTTESSILMMKSREGLTPLNCTRKSVKGGDDRWNTVSLCIDKLLLCKLIDSDRCWATCCMRQCICQQPAGFINWML